MDMPDLLRTASTLARHASTRLEHISRNVANADTPEYKPVDLEPFSQFVSRLGSRARADGSARFREVSAAIDGAQSPNGNAVSLEDQAWRSGEAARQHETATTIYGEAISMLRTALKGGR